jgi:hypothetical protein
MSIDNKISFWGGYFLTAVTSVNLMGFVNAAIIGLIGGFFGLLGKEVYYYVKGEIKDKFNDHSKTK